MHAFGQLFAYKDTSEKKNDGVSIGIRGPVTVQATLREEPVEITSTQITESVSGEGDGAQKASDTMDMKHRVNQETYVFYGAISPQLASLTGFRDEDSEILKNVLPFMFEGVVSSAHPEGSMEVKKVIW